ncbi:MAG: hypothetical protein EON54_19585, partial [Alcaligenaceae bacterium]
MSTAANVASEIVGPPDDMAGLHRHPAPTAMQDRPWIIKVDNVLGLLVEIPAALLVLAEIIVLFAGVFARFVLNAPLIWSDE